MSIIDATSGAAVNVGFDAFDHETLAGMGIILKKNTAPAVDLEPEYIATSNDKAYVSLQEANAIAVIDLDAERVDGIYSAGFEDLGETAFDINKDDEQYAARTYPGVKSIRMPDGISLYEANGKTYTVTCVSMGNPHCVIFVDDIKDVDLTGEGPHLEVDAHFPKKTNTEFVEQLGEHHFRMRVWERGTGITMACGTGTCATVVAAILNGRTKDYADVDLDGGVLHIEWDGKPDSHVFMTGPAVKVFEGDYFG